MTSLDFAVHQHLEKSLLVSLKARLVVTTTVASLFVTKVAATSVTTPFDWLKRNKDAVEAVVKTIGMIQIIQQASCSLHWRCEGLYHRSKRSWSWSTHRFGSEADIKVRNSSSACPTPVGTFGSQHWVIEPHWRGGSCCWSFCSEVLGQKVSRTLVRLQSGEVRMILGTLPLHSWCCRNEQHGPVN